MNLNRRGLLRAGAVALVGGTVAGCGTPATAEPLTVFAAASLTDPLTRIAAQAEAANGQVVRLSFAASGEIARQIEAGAPADVVLLADEVWMDRLEDKGMIAAGSRVDLLTNQLVVIAPTDAPVTDAPFEALLAGQGKLVIGDPESVPAGRYARQMLERMGLWDRVQDRIVTAADVRAVRGFVERGEASLGVVYNSDALGFDRVRVAMEPPAAMQPRIVYPAALTRTAGPGASAFLERLQGTDADAVFTAAGFGLT